MTDSPLPLPTIARQIKGEEHRLSQLLVQLGGSCDSHPEIWRALVERAVVCLRWAQDAILTVSTAAPAAAAPPSALPAQADEPKGKQDERGVGGQSAVVPVFTALQMLSGLGKSGSLRVESPQGNFEVLLEKGSVVYAQGVRPEPGERLGEILVVMGVLTEQQLESTLQRAQARGESVGTLLLRDRLVSPEQLSAALAEQACVIFSRIHSAGDARWRFEERMPESTPGGERLDPTPLMLRGAHAAAGQPGDDTPAA
jgi:hypothetical protein